MDWVVEGAGLVLLAEGAGIVWVVAGLVVEGTGMVLVAEQEADVVSVVEWEAGMALAAGKAG